MIDLILYAADKATLRDFGIAHGLLTAGGDPVQFVDYSWWAGTGKFMTDSNPVTYLPGVVALLHIGTAEDGLEEGQNQWNRSQIAKYVQNNGTPGTMGGLDYYEIDGVRMFNDGDVDNWLAARGLPRHEWCGGNSY